MFKEVKAVDFRLGKHAESKCTNAGGAGADSYADLF